jgi:hypothetical protein
LEIIIEKTKVIIDSILNENKQLRVLTISAREQEIYGFKREK